jgi:folate-binding protein YgfZ
MQSDLYAATRYGAAVLRQNLWNSGIIRLSGPDRLPWLQGMVTNDVEKLLPGQGTYAAHLNAQGKLISQMAILIDTDAVWLTMESSNVSKLQRSLEPMIVMEDVLSEDVSTMFQSIELIGPDSVSVIEKWLGEPLSLEKTYDHRVTSKCRRIIRDELGYTLWVDLDKSEIAVDEIASAGATVVDEVLWNIIRIESGLPIYGTDIDETTTLPELGERGISYDKGCYIGQEVVAKIKYIGHVNRRFMGFVCEGSIPPEPHSVVRSGGKDVGTITTSVLSPGMGKAIALGFVGRSAAVAGTNVELVSGESKIPAVVSELPFIPSPAGNGV